MKVSTVQIQVIGVLIIIGTVYSHNILGLFPTTAKSAFLASEAIMKELARRGHNVTVVSCFPRQKKISNYTDISIRSARESMMYESSIDIKKYNIPLNILDLTPIFTDLIEGMRSVLEFSGIQELLSSNMSFDVVFHEMFVDDIFLLISRKFNAPVIAIGPSYILPWAADRFAIPQNPSYIPVIANGYSDKMNFCERLWNTITLIRSKIDYWNILNPKSLEVYSKHYKETLPPFREVSSYVSMYFVNQHFTLNRPRPLPPQVIEIAGVHLKPVKALEQELQMWMDNAPFGVVYFCFGSMLRGASLPTEKVQIFLEVFRSFPQRVLWKWEDDPPSGVPEHVKMLKWLPQRDILGHKNIRFFISHGGLLGVTEAVAEGVPILGIPTNMDQANNIASLVDHGAGMVLDYNNITMETLYYSYNQMLTDSGYARNAKKLSERFLDRPQSPLDTAVYWTEYVIRHGGAPHLQSAAVHLTWYQYYLLDVIAVCLAALAATVATVVYIIKTSLRLMCAVKTTKLKSN
uniref:UDP-glucuronosyltransferase n=1 Tax=Homalodisca liturata TaxID=320908 RepID=A0A1B6H914_9HEMI